MKTIGPLLIAISLVPGPSFGFDQTHTHWTELLRRYQASDGKIHYQKLKTDISANQKHPFSLYLGELSAISSGEFDSWTRDDQIAFLINAYNALTIKLVLDHYPVASIRNIGGLFKSPWKMEFFSLLGGRIKTLDAIEQGYLRGKYQEPLIHSAINCASLSCPRIRFEAFTGKKLSSQLESSFREFLNDGFRNHYDSSSGILFLSEIFKWYGDDFKAKFGSYLRAIDKFGPAEAKRTMTNGAKVKWIPYDWSLNDADAPKK